MIRYVAVLRRRPDTTTREFLDAWLGTHRELATALPGVRRVDFQPVVRTGESEPGYDGVGFLDFDDQAALESSLASPAAQRLRAHTATFADSDATVRLVVDPEPRYP